MFFFLITLVVIGNSCLILSPGAGCGTNIYSGLRSFVKAKKVSVKGMALEGTSIILSVSVDPVPTRFYCNCASDGVE